MPFSPAFSFLVSQEPPQVSFCYYKVMSSNKSKMVLLFDFLPLYCIVFLFLFLLTGGLTGRGDWKWLAMQEYTLTQKQLGIKEGMRMGIQQVIRSKGGETLTNPRWDFTHIHLSHRSVCICRMVSSTKVCVLPGCSLSTRSNACTRFSKAACPRCDRQFLRN
jgi:hypothetical protein